MSYGGFNSIFGPWDTAFPGTNIADVCTNLTNELVPTYPIKVKTVAYESVTAITINGTSMSGFFMSRTSGPSVFIDSVLAPSAGRVPLQWRFSDEFYDGAFVAGNQGIIQTNCSMKLFDPPPTTEWSLNALASGGTDLSVLFDPPLQLFVYVYYI